PGPGGPAPSVHARRHGGPRRRRRALSRAPARGGVVNEPLSVLVPTKNEEPNIRAVLESVRFAQEVVVVDSGSTDGTLAIARSLATRVLEHEYVNSAAQKNWAIPQLTHRWIMIVEADERVTPELRAE